MAFSIKNFFSQHACGYIICSAADLPNSFFPFHFRIDIVFVIDLLCAFFMALGLLNQSNATLLVSMYSFLNNAFLHWRLELFYFAVQKQKSSSCQSILFDVYELEWAENE